MKWLNKEYALIAVRCAVVMGGIGVGATMPPPANAEEAPAPALAGGVRALESFAGMARGQADKGAALPAPRGVLDDFSAASPVDPESFARQAHPPRLVDDRYARGEGAEHFRGGGWPFEREYFNNRHQWPTAAVPEIRATTMTLVGLLGVALMARRQRRRRAFWAH